MSFNTSGIVVHPIELQFIGLAGREIPNEFVNDRGFVTHHATIETSGANNKAIRSTDVKLTATKSAENEVAIGNVYWMNCKLIGSNDAKPDYLHFIGATTVNLGPIEEIGQDILTATLNKVTIKALGMIVAKEMIPKSLPGESDACIMTLKSVDVDPITRSPVMWLSKHRISPVPTLESGKRMWKVGAIVHISGEIVGYDAERFMWISKVSCLQAHSGPMQTAAGPIVRHPYRLRSLARENIKNATWQEVLRVSNRRLLRFACALKSLPEEGEEVLPRKKRSRHAADE